MGHIRDLIIEHRVKGRLVGAKKLRPRSAPYILGSSQKSHLRLVGPKVGGVHAALEHRDDVWHLYDLGSLSGTEVDGKSVTETSIEKSVVVRVGDHELTIVPKHEPRALFEHNLDGKGGQHQQVVIRRGQTVIETRVLKLGENIDIKIGTETKTVSAATGSEWKVETFGDIEVRRRIFLMPEAQKPQPMTMDFSEKKIPILGTVGLVLLLSLFAILAPKKEDKPAENNVTQMIFDSKKMAQKREKAKANKTFEKVMSGGPAKAPQAPTNAPVATKVISSIKASGLQKLIGKIASRSALNANIIAVASAGRETPKSVAYASDSLVKDTKVGATAGAGFKAGKVTTDGKGGGGTGYAEGAGMASGNVGTGEVGAIEEESIVDGGLDPEVIAGVIRQQLGQIRYCYERQLSAQPDLYGKVAIKFVIGPDGRVTSQQVGSSTLKSANVEGCILRRVAGWKFPEPKGGTSVLVTYPFLFKAAN